MGTTGREHHINGPTSRSAGAQGDKETNKGSQGPRVGTLCMPAAFARFVARASEEARLRYLNFRY